MSSESDNESFLDDPDEEVEDEGDDDDDDKGGDDDDNLNGGDDDDDDDDDTNSKDIARVVKIVRAPKPEKTYLEELDEQIHSGMQPVFNEEGKLLQVEYANICAKKSETAVGILAKNGVAIVALKKTRNRLVEVESVKKIEDVTENIGMVYAGLSADFRQVVRQARKIAANFEVKQNSIIPVITLPRYLGSNLQEFTQTCNVRPYGLQLLIFGWHNNRPHLYYMDCIGSFESAKAASIGFNSVACNSYLQRCYSRTIFLEAAISLAIQAIKRGCCNNAIAAHQLNVAYADSSGVHQMKENEIEFVLSHLR